MGKRKPRFVETEMTIADASSSAFSEFESLAQELGEWRDNLEEKFSQTEKYNQVSEATDTLEEIQEVDVPDVFKDVKIKVQLRNMDSKTAPKSNFKLSRADRCGDACMILDAIIQYLDDVDEKDANHTEATDYSSELTDHKDNAEGVDFPGMY